MVQKIMFRNKNLYILLSTILFLEI